MPCFRFSGGFFPLPSNSVFRLIHWLASSFSLSLSLWSPFHHFRSYFVRFHHRCLHIYNTNTQRTNNSIHKHWKHFPDNDLSLWGFCGFATYGLSISYQNNTTQQHYSQRKNRTHASAFSQLIHSIKSFNINVCERVSVQCIHIYSEFTLNS